MKNETWEMSSLDWSQPGEEGVIVNPVDVGNLIFSENKEQAENAFFTVSEAVGQNGGIYPCALTVVKTVLAALPKCSLAARAECLELIAQIAVSESAPGEKQIAEECSLEIRNAYWYFVYGLQFDDEELTSLYVDILGCLGMRFEDLKCPVKKYLTLTLEKNLSKNDFDMVVNTIAELSK